MNVVSPPMYPRDNFIHIMLECDLHFLENRVHTVYLCIHYDYHPAKSKAHLRSRQKNSMLALLSSQHNDDLKRTLQYDCSLRE